MLSNHSQLQVEIEGKVYRFVCDVDAPIPYIKESLFQFLKYIGQVEDAHKAQLDKEKLSCSDCEKEQSAEVKSNE